jgi:hypothetical protein
MRKNLLVVFLLFCAAAALSAQTVVQQFISISKAGAQVSDNDLPEPSSPGSTLIAMPMLLHPDPKADVTIVSVTDNAPAGGNTYKLVPGSASSCSKQSLGIWYCENCNPGVTELKFHLSGSVQASIDAFLEVSGLLSTSVLDGDGAHISDGTATKEGVVAGPSLKTTANDLIIALYFATPPLPTGVSPAVWKYTKSYVYQLNGAPGEYKPTLTGGNPGGNYCVSMAAFKVAPPVAPPPPAATPPAPATPPEPQH